MNDLANEAMEGEANICVTATRSATCCYTRHAAINEDIKIT